MKTKRTTILRDIVDSFIKCGRKHHMNDIETTIEVYSLCSFMIMRVLGMKEFDRITKDVKRVEKELYKVGVKDELRKSKSKRKTKKAN